MINILSKYAVAIALLCLCQALEAQEISSFTLINAKEDIEIGVLSDVDSIYIQDYNTNEFSVRADVTGNVRSVLFELDGEVVGADNRPAYALLGNPGNDYTSWIPEMRSYTITGSAYSLPQGGGTLLDTYSITVTFVDEAVVQSSGPVVQSLVLVNADSDEDISEIDEGSIFILDDIGTRNLNIRAEVDSLAQSVVFGYQEEPNYHTENLIEYAIGANDDDDYRPWVPDLGPNTVTATAFTEDRGAGTSGNSLTVNFEIVEEARDTIPPFELRINSGGEAVLINDSLYFAADTLFVGNGKVFENHNIIDILETETDSIYKTERTSNGSPRSFGYAIPVINGEYDVKLHFAEIYWGAIGGGDGGAGKRIFSVSIEDEEVLVDYDMSVESGSMTAIVKVFSAAVADGQLNIDFAASVDQPKVAALEISSLTFASSKDCAWKELASSQSDKLEVQSVKVNDKLYVIGNNRNDSLISSVTEIYDPVLNTWSTGSPLPVEVKNMGAVGVADQIWIIGGVEMGALQTVTDRVQIYNTVTDTWSAGPSLPSPRMSGATTLSDGKIHFFGGLLSDKVTAASEHYILDLNDSLANWQSATPLPDPRNRLGAASVNGKIYAIGGQSTLDSLVQEQSFLDEYDPLTDSWTRKTDLPSPRSHFESSVGVHNNKIIVVGGKKHDSILNTVSKYDITLDSWTELCSIPDSVLTTAAKVFGDSLIVVNANGGTFSMPLAVEIPNEPETPIDDDISVLIYHETGGFRHNSIEAGIEMVSEFGNELGWKVNASQTSAVFQVDSLATYDVVIWLNTTGEELLTLEEQSAFEGFIQNGGGFVGVHSATDTYRNGSWPWYNDLVGAIVQVNPYHTANNTNATIDVVGEHPAVEHLGNEWNKNEEYYYWERNGGYLFDGNIDLLRVRSTGPNSYDIARPVTWYKEYDGGRSFYTALGHNTTDYQNDESFRTMLKEAILWAASRDESIAEDEEPTVIIDSQVDDNIILAPNPVADKLSVNSELFSEEAGGEIAIFGLDGNMMRLKAIDSINNQIDISDLPSGYYIASLKVGAISERHLIYKN